MSQRPILRSYSEIRNIIHQIESRVHKYLPDYTVTTFTRPQYGLGGGHVLAVTDEETKTIAFWIQYLETGSIDDIMVTVNHEIAHPFDYEPRVDRGHGMDWSYTSHALGGDFMGINNQVNVRRERYLWRCADCGKEVISEYKTKLPSEFISPCPARTNPPGSSHLNFYVTDAITRRRGATHIH